MEFDGNHEAYCDRNYGSGIAPITTTSNSVSLEFLTGAEGPTGTGFNLTVQGKICDFVNYFLVCNKKAGLTLPTN